LSSKLFAKRRFSIDKSINYSQVIFICTVGRGVNSYSYSFFNSCTNLRTHSKRNSYRIVSWISFVNHSLQEILPFKNLFSTKFFELIQSSQMSPTSKFCFQKDIDCLFRFIFSNKTRTKTQNVRIIMLSRYFHNLRIS